MNKSIHFTGQPTFSQLIKLIPKQVVSSSIERSNSDHYYKRFTTWHHLVTMLFSCYGHCDSLREVVSGMRALEGRLQSSGIRYFPARSTFSEANAKRDSKVRLRPRVAGEEPDEDAVVELEVGREVDATDRGAAEDVDEALPARAPALAGGEQQRDIRIVRSRQAIAHEESGVGILDADALVVADLAWHPLPGARPRTISRLRGGAGGRHQPLGQR